MKFENLTKNSTHTIKPLQTVHNLSNIIINKDTMDILEKGFNYAVTPTSIPTENIITNVEIALKDVNDHAADKIRLEVAHILKNAHLPKQNITKAQKSHLKELKNNKDILILRADKGNSTVIVNTSDYNEKMMDLLNSNEYKKSNSNPTTYLEKRTKTLINSTNLSDEIKRELIPREKSSRVPKIYGLPKIHKGNNWPLRPIVSAFNSPTHKLAGYLAKQLKPFYESAQSYIKIHLTF
ncbi:hypothetical protein RI129_001151 [Pyrocoelia pectoralis]|uniref:Uncharacterized protein n=1 Tax=Pyrocoelia pectoralis TaxID=417401 RepID=A0AAN7ZPH6_9COLE